MNNQTSTEPASPPSAYLDKLQAAALFGISPRTLDCWMKRRLLPFLRIGRTIRFDRADIARHLQSTHRVGGVQ